MPDLKEKLVKVCIADNDATYGPYSGYRFNNPNLVVQLPESEARRRIQKGEAYPAMTIRLTRDSGGVANASHYWPAESKYTCTEREAKIRLTATEGRPPAAVTCTEEEPAVLRGGIEVKGADFDPCMVGWPKENRRQRPGQKQSQAFAAA